MKVSYNFHSGVSEALLTQQVIKRYTQALQRFSPVKPGIGLPHPENALKPTFHVTAMAYISWANRLSGFSLGLASFHA